LKNVQELASHNQYQKESVNDSILNFESVNFKSVFAFRPEDLIQGNSFQSEKFSNLKKNIQTAKKPSHIKNFTLNMNVYTKFKFKNIYYGNSIFIDSGKGCFKRLEDCQI